MLIQQVPYNSPEYQAICALRYDVLRKPIGMELREKDVALDHTEFLIAAIDNGRVIGCVQLRPLEKTHIKLRQMAVADSHQGQGIGARLVRFGEQLAAQNGFKTMETSARKTAQGFYEKLGFAVQGDPFMEVELHTIKMTKTL